MIINKNIAGLLCICAVYLLSACTNKDKESPILLFSANSITPVVSEQSGFDENSLALIVGLQCNDSSLVVLDNHSGYSFTLFSLYPEEYIGRFGRIGRGPGEILYGASGTLNGGSFDIYSPDIDLIAKYSVSGLYSEIESGAQTLAKFNIPNAHFSKVIPINDKTFLGAGAYNSTYQFLLFNSNDDVLDYAVEIFNKDDRTFNEYHKYLSNQGVLRKHPSQNKFVYSITHSSNIDFIEVNDGSINLVNSIRLRDPEGKPFGSNGMNYVIPDSTMPIGYIDLAFDTDYVYALYTDKKGKEPDGRINSTSSNLVLVFDWDGNPVKMYRLDRSAYYIAVNKVTKKMYCAVKDSGAWNIVRYDL